MIAFYPVFGEVVFFYLLYQELQNQHNEQIVAEAPFEEGTDDLDSIDSQDV